MKVITRCVISMKTLQVVNEESYEYRGKIALCKGGGSSGSGTINYPDYMERVHEDWLDQTGTDTISDSITGVMNVAMANSPWNGQSPFDPDTDLTSMETAIAAFKALIDALVATTNWASLFTQGKSSIGTVAPITPIPAVSAVADITIAPVTLADISVANIATLAPVSRPDAVVGNATVAPISIPNIVDSPDLGGITDANIIADVNAFADQLDDEITTKVLPRFRAGMLDINAVVTSSFVVGESNIEAFRDREVAKHASGLRVTAELKNADIEAASEQLHLEVRKANQMKDIEVGRLNIGKNIQVALANLSKDVSIGTINLEKAVDLGKVSYMGGMEVLKSNLSKNIEIGKANQFKDIETMKLFVPAQLEASKSNQAKNVEVEKMTTTIKISNADRSIKRLAIIADYNRSYLEASSQMLKILLQRINWYSDYSRIVVEQRRIKIVAKVEENEVAMKIDEYDAMWDLEVFTHGCNVMASIAGGTGLHQKQPSMAQSAIGGALSGAAMGTMIGGPGWGTAIGAAAGFASAFL